MEKHYLVRIEGVQLITKSRAHRYLSLNLSMIVDEKKSIVFDVVSRKPPVGTLDEPFVISWISPGAVFFTRDRMWRVLDIDEDRIMVDPAKNAKWELPSLEGEQIPVPFAVAMEGVALRRQRNYDGYHADAKTIAFTEKNLDEMQRNRSMVATDRVIVLENADEGIVVNLCVAAIIRSTRRSYRVLSILLSARYGTSVGIETNAYRILLRLPRFLRAADVDEVLCSLDSRHVEAIFMLALKKKPHCTSGNWCRLVQIAKKFGAIDADADYEKISINWLMDLFDNTVIEREVFRELFFANMNVANAREVVQCLLDH